MSAAVCDLGVEQVCPAAAPLLSLVTHTHQRLTSYLIIIVGAGGCP